MATDSIAQEIANDCIGYRVRMLNRVVSRVYDDQLRPYGVRFSQMNILTVVALKGAVQPAEVGRVLAIEKSTLSRNVRIMDENGWLKSEASASGTGNQLRLTKKGERLYEKAAKAWRRAQEQVEAMLGQTGVASIAAAVKRTRET